MLPRLRIRFSTSSTPLPTASSPLALPSHIGGCIPTSPRNNHTYTSANIFYALLYETLKRALSVYTASNSACPHPSKALIGIDPRMAWRGALPCAYRQRVVISARRVFELARFTWANGLIT